MGKSAALTSSHSITQEELLKVRHEFLTHLRSMGVKEGAISRNRLDRLFDGLSLQAVAARQQKLGELEALSRTMRLSAADELLRAAAVKRIEDLLQDAELLRFAPGPPLLHILQNLTICAPGLGQRS